MTNIDNITKFTFVYILLDVFVQIETLEFSPQNGSASNDRNQDIHNKCNTELKKGQSS